VGDFPEQVTVVAAELVPPALRQRLDACSDLPALPPVAARVLELCRQDDLDLRQVADTIAGDHALAGIILRLVNSPVFGLRQQIRSTSHAIALLGLNAVRTLALSCSLARELHDARRSDFGTTWKRSVVAAVAGRELALTLRFPAPDEAFLAALLQDIGMHVLERVPGLDYAASAVRAGGDPARLNRIERDLCGADHGAVGGWLLATWNLPAPLCLAVATSENGGPDLEAVGAHDDVRQLARIVRLSGVLADVWVDADVARAIREARKQARAALGLGTAVIDPILSRTAAAIPGVASLFELSFGPAEEIAATLEQAAATLATTHLQPVRPADWAHAAADTAAASAGAAPGASVDRDELTGLASRAWLEQYLAQQFTEAEASGKPLSVIVAEVDGLTAIVQASGRTAGDETLVGVARVLDGNLRTRDLVARSGAEEFVLVLPETDGAGARIVAERLRQKIEALAVVGGRPSAAVTASFGCATLGPVKFATAAELLGSGARALAEARSAGRNRVETDRSVPARAAG
jgi:diguanylate cyclase (GGDEF)-like protein